MEVVQEVYRPDIYATAAKELVLEGLMSSDEFPDFDSESGFRPPSSDFLDGIEFDGRKPNDYLRKLAIGHKD